MKIHRKATIRLYCLLVLSLCTTWFMSIHDVYADSQPTVKIGIIGAFKFTPGKHYIQGAKMAIEEINEAGGIDVGGKKYMIETFFADSNEFLSLTDAASAMERLINVKKVDFVVGGHKSEGVIAMQEVMADYPVLFLSGSGAMPAVHKLKKDYETYKYWFRGIHINTAIYGQVMFAQLNQVANKVRQELGIATPKVAFLFEKAVWTDLLLKKLVPVMPKFGLEFVGAWRPSPTATDVTAELTAITHAGAHIIFDASAGPVGSPMSRTWGELQIPAALIGLNTEGGRAVHWKNTSGMCEYEYIATDFYGNIEYTDVTFPFINNYMKKFDAFPTYSAGIYDTIYIIKEAVERAGTLDKDALVVALEKTDHVGAAGRVVFYPLDHKWPHDMMGGPGYVTGIGNQWRNGKKMTVWPDGKEQLGDKRYIGLRYEGTIDYELPPWMVEYWKKKLKK